MRRGRVHLVKIAISVVVVLVILYVLFSDSDAHARARKAIHARLSANKPKEKPELIKGNWIMTFIPIIILLFDANKNILFFYRIG